jgi:hypothetical protein
MVLAVPLTFATHAMLKLAALVLIHYLLLFVGPAEPRVAF